MTSSMVGRMDKAQRRRLMAALIADAISAGKLQPGVVDFSALLFGDPDLWTEFRRHGAMVEKVIATSPAATQPTTSHFVGKALPTAMKAVEDDIVQSLGIEAAQEGRGGGKSGDDTEYRRIRSKRKNYVHYLAERGDYERFNRSLQEAYSKKQAASLSAGDLAKVFSLPVADVDLCRDEVEALVAVWAAPPDADPRSFVPTREGTPRRGLVLIDTAGRPRWGKRQKAGIAPATSKPTAALPPTSVERKPSETAPIVPAETVSHDPDALLRDAAILRARVGLRPDDMHAAALPTDWETATLSIARIIQLLPYPRPCHLDTALSVFGHAPQEACVRADPAIAAALEVEAASWRTDFLKLANEGELRRVIITDVISDRWWRALDFYRNSRWVSGESAVGPKWPDPWEYLTAARADVYTNEGRIKVAQLDAIAEVIVRLVNEPREEWEAAFADLKQRGGHYVSIVSIAQQPGVSNPARLLISSWANISDANTVAELLPGFAD